jgi:dTDP-4-dehydrorhamnose reductase
MKALIGRTGFVGSTLAAQWAFDEAYASADVDRMRGRAYSLVVCAAAPGQKWLANREPAQDRARIARLVDTLSTFRAETMILISTVDVFRRPVGVDEGSPVVTEGLQPYGLHRYELELAVRERFPDAYVVRLAGLVGAGLRKNVLYDLKHARDVSAVDARAELQFYPTARLGRDLDAVVAHDLRLAHLTAHPLPLGRIAAECFGASLAAGAGEPVVRYDFRTRRADAFGAAGPYQVDAAQAIAAIRAYASAPEA